MLITVAKGEWSYWGTVSLRTWNNAVLVIRMVLGLSACPEKWGRMSWQILCGASRRFKSCLESGWSWYPVLCTSPVQLGLIRCSRYPVNRYRVLPALRGFPGGRSGGGKVPSVPLTGGVAAWSWFPPCSGMGVCAHCARVLWAHSYGEQWLLQHTPCREQQKQRK